MSVLALAALTVLAQDGGTGFARLRGGEVRLELSDARPKDRDFPTEVVRAALAKGLDVEHIRVAPDAKRVLKIQLEQVEHRENDAIFNCALVRGRMIDRDHEFLPTTDVVNERCLAESPRGTAYTPVPDAVRAAVIASNAKAEPYAIALAEVLTVLERRLR